MREKQTCAVYISYSHTAEKHTPIKHQLEEGCLTQGVELIHEERELLAGDHILDYMDKIGQGDMVITVLSDEYFQSEYCMYELLAITKKGKVVDRLIPARLHDYDSGKSQNQKNILKYWKAELSKVEGKASQDIKKKLRYTEFVESVRSMMEELGNLLAINTTGTIDQAYFSTLLKRIREKQGCLPKPVHDDEQDKRFRQNLHKELAKFFTDDEGELLQKTISQQIAQENSDWSNVAKEVPSYLCRLCQELDEDNEHQSKLGCAIVYVHEATAELLNQFESETAKCKKIAEKAEDVFKRLILYAIRNDWLAKNKSTLSESGDFYFEIPVETEAGIEIVAARLNQRDPRFEVIKDDAFVHLEHSIPPDDIESGWQADTPVEKIICDIWNHFFPSNHKERCPEGGLSKKELGRLRAKLKKPARKSKEHHFMVLPDNKKNHPLNDKDNRKQLFEKLPTLTIFAYGSADDAVWFYPEFDLMEDIQSFLLMTREHIQ